MNDINNTINFLRKLIINTADKFIEETEVSQHDIEVIDNFADCLLTSIETISAKISKVNK